MKGRVELKLKVISWRYIPSSGASLKQGVKGGRRPKNAVRGGYGSYIINDPPQVIVTMEDDNGERNTLDVYPTLKSRMWDVGAKRLSDSRVDKILKYYQNLGKFDADEWYDLPAIPDGLI